MRPWAPPVTAAAAGTLVATAAGPAPPTWHEDVAPLVFEHCGECHAPGGIAPFPLLSYEDASPLADAIARATAERHMPPFNLDNSGECNTYVGARWLADEEIATLGAWAEAGAPRGTPGELPPLAEPEALDRVDLTVAMAEPYTPDERADDDYRCFVVDPGLAEDRFVTGFAVHPGEPRMVHHFTLFALDSAEDEREAEALDAAEPGPGYTCFGDTRVRSRWLVGSGPGVSTTRLPAGTGTPLGAGRKAVLQMHYNRVNGTWPDLTTIDLQVEADVARVAEIDRLAVTDLELPPGQPEVVRTDTVELDRDVTVVGLWPHMHDLGTRLEVTAVRPGSERCLARVDHYEFHWQSFEFYTEPIRLRAGDRLRTTCTYDTTGRDTTTRWGEGTDDEMCIAFLYVTE